MLYCGTHANRKGENGTEIQGGGQEMVVDDKNFNNGNPEIFTVFLLHGNCTIFLKLCCF